MRFLGSVAAGVEGGCDAEERRRVFSLASTDSRSTLLRRKMDSSVTTSDSSKDCWRSERSSRITRMASL